MQKAIQQLTEIRITRKLGRGHAHVAVGEIRKDVESCDEIR